MFDICGGIRPGTAAGYGNIHISVVKSTIDIISLPLTHVINLSISSGVVPREHKITRVIPLFKTGDEAVLSSTDRFRFFHYFQNS